MLRILTPFYHTQYSQIIQRTSYNLSKNAIYARKGKDGDTHMETSLLKFCETARTKKEIADFIGIVRTYSMVQTYIEPLVEEGKLIAVRVNPKTTKCVKYVTVGFENNKPLFIKEQILEYCRTPRSAREIVAHFKYSLAQTIEKLNYLLDQGLIALTHPSYKLHKWQKYVTVEQPQP